MCVKKISVFTANFLGNTQILILAEAPLRFVLKVFSVLRRWRARYSVPSGCLGRTVVQNLTPDVAFLTVRLCSLVGTGPEGLYKLILCKFGHICATGSTPMRLETILCEMDGSV